MRQPWHLALAACCTGRAFIGLCLFGGFAASAAAQDIEGDIYAPHLELYVNPPPPRVYPGPKFAVVVSFYEVDTIDWEAMKVRMTERLAASLGGISVDYLELSHVEPLLFGDRCKAEYIVCDGYEPGSNEIRDANPASCRGIVPPVDPLLQEQPDHTWLPLWFSDDELEMQVWDTFMCVSPTNTSLIKYPIILNGTYITGHRSDDNSRVSANSASGEELLLYVVGIIPVPWAKFINAKFQMNGSIPLPEVQPGVVDETATHTNELNISIKIFGIRDRALDGALPPIVLATYLPICPEPTLTVKGCFRVDHDFYEHPSLTFYKMQYRIFWTRHIFVQTASDLPYPQGEFNASRLVWPLFDMVTPPPSKSIEPWVHFTFPQEEWVFQEECRYGNVCDVMPLAPSPRYFHTAVLYKTWSFSDAHPFLCNNNPACGPECLTNLTCLGGVSYFDDSFFFRSEQFKFDDGEIEPTLDITSIDCPRTCCRDRRLCMRKYDILGYEVPFDATYMLVFGGRTYVHEYDSTGQLVYHNCEQIPLAEFTNHPEWRSCLEVIVNELWRYDITRGKWEFLKPDSSNDPSTGLPVGYPLSRYGHAATMVEAEDSPGFVRKWLYIYGGLGPQCTSGVCNDMWKYEIPWAAQAYYPKFPDQDWDRGNMWYRLKDSPFGGRYRHAMVTTSSYEYIYVFGGQGIGVYYDNLYRYRISTDNWEDLRPFGRLSLTRLMYDYQGIAHVTNVSPELYNPAIDVDCTTALNFDGAFRHCSACHSCRLSIGRRGSGAELPEERIDFGLTYFTPPEENVADDTLIIVGGYRTTWGDEESSAGAGVARLQAGQADNRFYFNDVWTYDSTFNRFIRQPTTGSAPEPRGGHGIVAHRPGNDTQIIMFGGHNHDIAFNDLWILDVVRPTEERVWTRIDPYIRGARPPATAYHTLVYSASLNLLVLFGGLGWPPTDLEWSDARRNIDRRCLKEAQELPEKWNGTNAQDPWNEANFLTTMRQRCVQANFCCPMDAVTAGGPAQTINGVQIRAVDGGPLDLMKVSLLCRGQCDADSFVPAFNPTIGQGVWTFSPQACPNHCNGRGVCMLTQCICNLEWYGADCSLPRCPGSTCYTHPRTQEQFCVECSQHGRCVAGRCQCFPGWGFDDCSAAMCENNCTSTLEVTRGVCIPDFPTHTCVCRQGWAGRICNISLCLNSCSGRGTCVDGACLCQPNYHGQDCSLFVFPLILSTNKTKHSFIPA